jgi:polysaccharide transporter, PST family
MVSSGMPISWFSTRGLPQAEVNQRVLAPDDFGQGLGARTIGGGALAMGAQAVRLVLQIGSTAILARLLAPEQFGLIAMGATVMALLSALTELNVSTVAIQKKELDQNTTSALLIIGLVMGLIAMALSMAAAPAAAWFFNDDRVTIIVVALAAAAPLNALAGHQYALLSRNMRWSEVQISSLGGLIIGINAAIIAAWAFDAGYWALIIQTWAAAAASAALTWIFCPWRPTRVTDWASARGSLGVGVNLTGAMVFNYVHRQADNALIGWRWGSTELGFYARAYALLMTPMNFLSGPLGTALIPALSKLQDQDESWRRAYLDALAVVAIAGGGMACLLYGGATPIIDLVLGPNWHRAAEIFAFLSLGLLATVPMDTTGWIYISKGRTDRMLRWSMIGVPIYVAAFVVGLPYGAAGVALCYSISRYIAFLPCFWYATRGTNISLADILITIAAPFAVAAAIGLGLREITAQLGLLGDWAAMAIAGLIYAALMLGAVWRLAPYRRLRERAAGFITTAQARLAR